MKKKNFVSQIFQKQVIPATGCTDVGAICLTSSIAYNAIIERLPTAIAADMRGSSRAVSLRDVSKIEVEVDKNTFKNAVAVKIPGINGYSGIEMAAAAGIFCDPEKGLEIFDSFPSDRKTLKNLTDLKKKVKVKIIPREKSRIYINTKITVKEDPSFIEGSCVIQNHPSNVVFVSRGDTILFRKKVRQYEEKSTDEMTVLSKMQLVEIIDIIQQLSNKDRRLIVDTIRMNKRVAEYGLKNDWGLNIGGKIQKLMQKELIKDDLVNYAKMKTAAAVDLRMAGGLLPVMSCGGSGNLGLMASVPIISVAEKVGWHEKKLIEAVALSFLLVCYVTYYADYLTPICGGAIKAGIGIAGAAAYYLGGTIQQIGSAINNFAGGITGMICDGAKLGCALKAMSAAASALESALLALEGVDIPSDNGIIEENPMTTLRNIGTLAKSMAETDRVIVSIIQNKKVKR